MKRYYMTAESADDGVLFMFVIGVVVFKFSTCFPHFGQIIQSLSICSPQNLQYFLFPIGVPQWGHDDT